MQQKKVRDIAIQLSKKYNIPLPDMIRICEIPMDFLADTMSKKADKKSLYFPSVRITGLGIFYCTNGKREFFRKLNEKNNQTS